MSIIARVYELQHELALQCKETEQRLRLLEHLKVKLLSGKYAGREATVNMARMYSHRNQYMVFLFVDVPNLRRPGEVLNDHPDARRGYKLSEIEFISVDF